MSGLLPPRVQDEEVDNLLRSLPDAPDTAGRVLDSLFKLGASKATARQQAAAAEAGEACWRRSAQAAPARAARREESRGGGAASTFLASPRAEIHAFMCGQPLLT